MGLDAVELVMDLEDAFGIDISADDSEHFTTVGDLFEFLKARTDLAPAGTCLSASTFYEIKNGLRSAGIGERFGPSTDLATILPRKDRRSLWTTLERNTQFRLPTLARPSWVIIANVAITTSASILLALIASGQEVSGVVFFAVGIACLFIIGFLTALVTRPLATNFGAEFRTFRGLSERVLALNVVKIRNKHSPNPDQMSTSDIWIVLKNIIVEQLGVDADEVTPEANFVKDLGLD